MFSRGNELSIWDVITSSVRNPTMSDDSRGPKALRLRVNLLECQLVLLRGRQPTCIDIEELECVGNELRPFALWGGLDESFVSSGKPVR